MYQILSQSIGFCRLCIKKNVLVCYFSVHSAEVTCDLQRITTLQYLVKERRNTDKEALLFLVQPYGTHCH